MRIRLGDDEPQVDESAWIAPTATLIGKVRIGPEVGIWYNAVLRAEMELITIGARSNIQDGCVLHVDPGFPLLLGTGVSVGHNAILHGCTVGDDVLIGMGATVLNGATIGAGSLIAANALIPQGAEIPPNSLVAGVPGKVRRELGDAERDTIKLNAAAYLYLREVHTGGVVLD
ncbi:gamma carbonic anhydrase family protein [Skermania piniformis]|uniref:Gamma carbonic anhydrase family protein n=1 Tax=Skermania pinensis TaxID=39122 RepID=A0ABX8SAW4_9ACTN|nr:gamma carbonic anhydrase family protein [Skermania piniformis]QXQ14999.1 gamma carbonic anhydrase family protein [Skermania piniformis]